MDIKPCSSCGKISGATFDTTPPLLGCKRWWRCVCGNIWAVWKCRDEPITQWCDMIQEPDAMSGLGGFMGHTCEPRPEPKVQIARPKGEDRSVDRNDSLRIAHAANCPVAQPGFRVIEGRTQCTCDFGRRMGEHLLETMPDAYERRADGSVGLRGQRGED